MPKSPKPAISWRRKLTNGAALSAIVLATAVVIVPLFLIMGTVAYHGIAGLNWAFFTQMPKPPGEVGGGMANALVGSGIILLVASVIGIPLGIGTGIFLSEYGRNIYGNVVRFTADVLNGVPSIVIGLTAWALVVVTQGHFSAFSGGVALGIMMIPTVSRTTEEVLLMVPARPLWDWASLIGEQRFRLWFALRCQELLPASCWPSRALPVRPRH